MTLGFIAALIGVFVGLVALIVAIAWLLEKYGVYIIVIGIILGGLAVLGYVAWLITETLVSKG
ncbi:MAG TPA: hypothetical protein VM537_32855 [Anaerolineae bacterium]|nr:hypothetical protein [Anaerolineae bacterium]